MKLTENIEIQAGKMFVKKSMIKFIKRENKLKLERNNKSSNGSSMNE